MTAGILFVIMLIIGVLLAFLGSKASDKSKVIFIMLGVVSILVAVFGIFTSLI